MGTTRSSMRRPAAPPVCGVLVLALALLAAAGHAQTGPELTRLVDSPTAGVLGKGRYELDLRLFGAGGLAAHLAAGALQRLTIGVAYGGEHILGAETIDWYPRLEAGIRYRLFEETIRFPALVVGYETQGYGAHDGGHYVTKSKGAYCALSKNYLSALGQFGVHGGANLTAETDEGDDDWSAWVGVDKSINEQITLVAEYELGRQADGEPGSGLAHPLLHAAARLQLAPQLGLSLLLRDLLRSGDAPQITRELSVRYTEEF